MKMSCFNMYKEVLPSKLKKARENTGFTQRQVAKETFISQPSIAQYETGTRLPDIEALGILAEFYDVTTDWLLGIGNVNNYNLIRKKLKAE